ncbi:floury 1-like protein [Tanacetum coccineum]
MNNDDKDVLNNDENVTAKKHIVSVKPELNDQMMDWIIAKYGKPNANWTDSLFDIIVDDVYTTFFYQPDHAKESSKTDVQESSKSDVQDVAKQKLKIPFIGTQSQLLPNNSLEVETLCVAQSVQKKDQQEVAATTVIESDTVIVIDSNFSSLELEFSSSSELEFPSSYELDSDESDDSDESSSDDSDESDSTGSLEKIVSHKGPSKDLQKWYEDEDDKDEEEDEKDEQEMRQMILMKSYGLQKARKQVVRAFELQKAKEQVLYCKETDSKPSSCMCGLMNFLNISNPPMIEKWKVVKETINGKTDLLDEDHDDDTKQERYDEDEVFDLMTMRRLVKMERQRANDAFLELEKERMSSTTASEEALAMILRLQNQLSVLEMEAQQHRRLTHEKQVHDQEVIQSLRWIVMKHESERSILEDRLRLCKQRLLMLHMNDDGDDANLRINRSLNCLDALDEVLVSSLDLGLSQW